MNVGLVKALQMAQALLKQANIPSYVPMAEAREALDAVVVSMSINPYHLSLLAVVIGLAAILVFATRNAGAK